MDITILEDIGLTQAEIKIYMVLLKLGSSTAGPIISASELQSSVVYATLKKLLKKGFVSFVIKGRIRHYSAVEPEYLVKYLDKKRSELEELVPLLKDIQKPYEEQFAKVFEGFDAYKIMQYDFIEDGEPGDEYLFFSFNPPRPEKFQYFFNYLNKFEQDRNKLGLVVKGIAPLNLKPFLKERNQENIVYVDFPTPNNIAVFRNKVLFLPWTEEKQMTFLIHSEQLAESFRAYFYSVWRKHHKD